MKIAIINDSHFGVRGDSQVFTDHFDLFYSDFFFPTLEKEGVKTVLHLGDLTDKRTAINYFTAQKLDEIFVKPLYDRDIECHIIAGNHDCYFKNNNDVNSLKSLYGQSQYKNLKLHWNDPVELEFDGLKILMVPWISKSNYDQFITTLGKTTSQIVMGHFDIKGFEMMKGIKSDHGFEPSLFSEFEAVYSGHYHLPSNQGNISYLGAPYEMNWSDCNGKRGFSILDTKTRKLTFYENPYKIHHMVSYIEEDYDELMKTDFSHINNGFVRLLVTHCEDKFKLDKVIKHMDSFDPYDLKTVENSKNLAIQRLDEEIENVEDTLSILKTSVSDLKPKTYRDKIEKELTTLYQEALTL